MSEMRAPSPKQGEKQAPTVQFRPGGRGGARGMMQREKPKNTKKTLARLLGYLGANRGILIALLVVMTISSLLTLLGPSLQGAAVNAVANQPVGALLERLHLTSLFSILCTMLGVYLCASALTYLQGLLAARLSQRTVYQMRNDLFRKISYLPISYTDRHRHGDLMSRMTNDVENISNTVSQSIASLFSALIMVIGSLTLMLIYSPLLTLISVLTIPMTLFLTTVMGKVMRRHFKKQQMLLGRLNSHVEENVSAYATLVAYGQEKRSVAEFSNISRDLRNTAIRAEMIGGFMGPIMNSLHNFGFLLIAVAGGIFASRGMIEVGLILTFIGYSKQFTRPINEIAHQYAGILTSIAGAERVFEVMDAPTEYGEEKEPLDVSRVRGELTFDRVDFGYLPETRVLKELFLSVPAGAKIAFVGRTGSGKTTVVNLLTRFYDVHAGSILLDGRNIHDYSRASMRKSIAIVLQDTVLFSDTIAANIRYGRADATDEEVRAAARMANADVFIERLPQQYETKLTAFGANLSQGQRQLLSIARAVLANPKILILDEATSNVDTRTELQIQSALLKLMEGRTSFVIAHRLSTIRDADRIVVLDNGHIVESGSHEELLAHKGVYEDLYRTQFVGIRT